jgi:hypothetical protein
MFSYYMHALSSRSHNVSWHTLNISLSVFGLRRPLPQDEFTQLFRHQNSLEPCQDPTELVGRVKIYQGNLTWEQAEENNRVIIADTFKVNLKVWHINVWSMQLPAMYNLFTPKQSPKA